MGYEISNTFLMRVCKSRYLFCRSEHSQVISEAGEQRGGGGSQSVTGFCGIEDISKCLSPAERFAFTCEHQDVADKRIRYQGFNLEQTSKISPRPLIFSEREDYWERPPSEVDSVLCFSVILVLILLWNLMFDVCLHWKREKKWISEWSLDFRAVGEDQGLNDSTSRL